MTKKAIYFVRHVRKLAHLVGRCMGVPFMGKSSGFSQNVEHIADWKLGDLRYTLEVNHHFKNGGSFSKMINPY